MTDPGDPTDASWVAAWPRTGRAHQHDSGHLGNPEIGEGPETGMQWLRRLVGGESGGPARVGLFVDGPNVLRDEFDVDLDNLRAVAEAEGEVAAARLYLDEHATPDLIKAAEARGFAVVTTSGDVDVRLASDATAAAVDGTLDVLVLVSRDTDFKPVLERAASEGRRTVAVAPGEHGRSDALRNVAHEEITL